MGEERARFCVPGGDGGLPRVKAGRGEPSGPDGERAVVVDSEETGLRAGGERRGGGDGDEGGLHVDRKGLRELREVGYEKNWFARTKKQHPLSPCLYTQDVRARSASVNLTRRHEVQFLGHHALPFRTSVTGRLCSTETADNMPGGMITAQGSQAV